MTPSPNTFAAAARVSKNPSKLRDYFAKLSKPAGRIAWRAWFRAASCSPSRVLGNNPAGHKKAGEYSEEDTHRPAHHYREVVARRTFGVGRQAAAIPPLEKETR